MSTPRLGTHLLGRRYEPDHRDKRLGDLLRAVDPGRDTDIPITADTTLRELYTGTSFLSGWYAFMRLWRIVKAIFHDTPPPPAPAPPPPADVPAWLLTRFLNQGNTGHCVGFGWAGWGDSTPISDDYGDADGHQIYLECKVIDKEPESLDTPVGEQQGTTVRSGAKAMHDRGRLGTYAFTATLDEARAWLNEHGPVVFGTDWWTDMFEPDEHGYVAPRGAVAGGHCYLALDDLADEGAILFQNSWGPDWGLGGRFKMKYEDVAKLLRGSDPNWPGEACAATELPIEI